MTVTVDGPTTARRGVVTAQIVLALGGLFIGTGEFAAMGLLPDIAASAGVSVPDAGHLISAYALGVVVGSPVLAILTARMERRRLLILLGVLVLIGNAASALAAQFPLLAAARFMAGLPHGAYYGTASIVAASLVPAEKRAQAIGHVMLGLAAANLVGVPLATFMGQWVGWRSAFAAIAAGGGLVAVLLPVTVPRLAARDDASPFRELAALRQLRVWLTLATAAVGFAGMFAVYSYITPTLTEVTRQAPDRVPLYLALWGLGMVVGNLAGGWLADRARTVSIIGLLAWNVVAFILFVPFAADAVAMAATLFLIGIGFALVPALQARLMDVAPGAPSLAASLNHSAFNLSNAIGAWTGGIAIDAGWGWSSTGGVAAILGAAGLAVFAVAVAVDKRSTPSAVGEPAFTP